MMNKRNDLKICIMLFSLSLLVILSTLFLLPGTHKTYEVSNIYSNNNTIKNMVLPLDETYKQDHHLETMVNVSISRSKEYIIDINFTSGKVKEIQEYANNFGYDLLNNLESSYIKTNVVINYFYKNEPYLSNTILYSLEDKKFDENILETYHPIKHPDMVWTTLPFKEFCDKYYNLKNQNQAWYNYINGMYISWVGVVVDKTEDSIVISCVPSEWNNNSLKDSIDKNLSALSYTVVCETNNSNFKIGEDVYLKGQIVSKGKKGSKNMHWKVYPIVITNSLR